MIYKCIVSFVFLLGFSGHLQAEFIYQVFQGGVGGKEIYEFSSPTPLNSVDYAPFERSGIQFFSSIDGNIPVFVTSTSIIVGADWPDKLHLVFSYPVPQTPGTYDLVPFFYIPANGDLQKFPIIGGSYNQHGAGPIGLPGGGFMFPDSTIPVDTLVISDPPDHSPEPASFILLLTGGLLWVGSGVISKCRRSQ